MTRSGAAFLPVDLCIAFVHPQDATQNIPQPTGRRSRRSHRPEYPPVSGGVQTIDPDDDLGVPVVDGGQGVLQGEAGGVLYVDDYVRQRRGAFFLWPITRTTAISTPVTARTSLFPGIPGTSSGSPPACCPSSRNRSEFTHAIRAVKTVEVDFRGLDDVPL